MEHSFWLERWDQDQIGFHQDAVNRRLEQFHDRVLKGHQRILVPLCGKTVDLWWLRDHGHQVVGVELSEKAVMACFQEEGVAPDVRQEGAFTVYSTADIEIWQGDFFTLVDQLEGQFDCAWDRAAMVALPPQMRVTYVAHLRRLVNGPVLLSTFDYPQQERKGPPHAVPDDEVRRHYDRVELLDEADLTEAMQQRGWELSRIEERVYRVDLSR